MKVDSRQLAKTFLDKAAHKMQHENGSQTGVRLVRNAWPDSMPPAGLSQNGITRTLKEAWTARLRRRLSAHLQQKRPALAITGIGVLLATLGWLLLINMPEACAQVGLPSLDVKVNTASKPEDVSKGLQILIMLTVLTLAPAILVMGTAFTRIVIVLSLVRQAIGTPQLPPNQVVIGLSLILTFFVMAPTFDQVNKTALQPYTKGEMSQDAALAKAMTPIRTFMFKQAAPKDLELFMSLAKLKRPKSRKDVPTYVLLPAFTISELKIAFQLGFIMFLPFLIIDMVVSSILVAMGMMFLPPTTIALPFKLILFVLVDGWRLICQSLVAGFG